MNKTIRKNIVVIGGGTGTFSVLTGLKKYPLDLSVIVTMADSGGSNRMIRDEFGLLPTSDIRQCIVALADENENEILRKLFTYRYTRGVGITGMTFGNLFMAALSDILGSQENAIKETYRLFNSRGNVIPVTYEKSNLVAKYEDGTTILGEHEIDEPDNRKPSRIKKISIFPKVQASVETIQAIKNADWIILGPGDLYTSILCNLIVGGVTKAIDRSKAKIIYVCNLMTRAGQTLGLTTADHVKEVNLYLGKHKLNYIVINQGVFPQEALEWYSQVGSTPVVDDLPETKEYCVIRKNVVSGEIYQKNNADKLIRSLIRHDSKKLGKTLYNLIRG